ncbi:MAG: Cholesterol 7-alpha-monooxygenase [Icmadophila ericetorum]|nr:Cholesterol 7-alpha-monooxygenase [Icmadophila ericetorum]
MTRVKGAIDTQIADLVSLKGDPFDHRMWEDSSNAKLVENESYSVEISLFPLIRNFVSLLTTPILVGSDFLGNYPYTIEDLQQFDAGMLYFLLKIPAWIPIEKTQSSHAARERLRCSMIELFTVMGRVLDGGDPGPRWQNLADVSEFMWERCKIWKQKGVPPNHYAGGELADA